MKGLFLDLIVLTPGEHFMREFGWTIPVALVVIAAVIVAAVMVRRKKRK